jgi:hypothetical protein
MERLFKLGRDAGERGVELGAQAVDHGDDRNRNASGDETIFYGRGPRIVLQEQRTLRMCSSALCVSAPELWFHRFKDTSNFQAKFLREISTKPELPHAHPPRKKTPASSAAFQRADS